MKPAQFEQPSRRADRSNRQTVITYQALSSNSRYTPDGSRKATFPDGVIFIQQFQLFRQKTHQAAPRRISSIASRKRYTPFVKFFTVRPPSNIIGEVHKLYRRLMNTYKAAV
ncbi:hypothetical protein CO657_10565 [Rhizobium acidisoli]|uniref:Uncharacterized protein n=1 Tax=Rhizobium acidisoli TaxID=1538158 RepID=A0AAE5WNJ8_9HYPH|nr:hypothetical protein CO657_10565 [Rhizobium acidisoli]